MFKTRLAALFALLALAVTPHAASADAAQLFPVTVETVAGPVQINSRPQRIVSLSATATEDLFAIGAGAQVIAVDDQSNYPKQAPMTKLSAFHPNAEAIAAYNPDLVVVSGSSIVAPLVRAPGSHAVHRLSSQRKSRRRAGRWRRS